MEFYDKISDQYIVFAYNHPSIIWLFGTCCFLYVLLGLAMLINSYLMPCLQTIIRKYQLPPNLAGFLIAVGCSVPEFSTNMISCLSEKPELVGFGFGSVVGSGVFDFTICFGIMSIFSFYVHQKAIEFDLRALLRDIIIYLLTLLFIVFVFWDYRISLIDSLILTLMMALYYYYLNLSKEDDKQPMPIATNSLNKANQPSMVQEEELYWQESYNIFVRNLPAKYHHPHYHEIPTQNLQDKHEGISIHGGGGDFDEEETFALNSENESKAGMPPNYFRQDLHFSHPHYKKALKIFQQFQKPWYWFYNSTIKYRTSPLISFCIIMFYVFIITRYNIFTVDCIIQKFKVSHAFLGLTFVSWGGNISDIINASIAAKNLQTELATSSIIGSQIFNLQICLGFPWLLTNLLYGEIPIVDPTIFTSIIVVYTVVLVSLGLILLHRLKLTYGLGIMLNLCYIVYMVFEYVQTAKVVE